MITKYKHFNESSNFMSKEELYNSIIKLYLKTGQGLPGYLMSDKKFKNHINELIDEGKVKIVEQKYSHLPDDIFICLTGVYCVEEDMKNNSRSLDFLRKYLNIPGNTVMDRMLDEFLDKNPKEREKYNKMYNDWLEKNKNILEKSFKIKPIKLKD